MSLVSDNAVRNELAAYDVAPQQEFILLVSTQYRENYGAHDWDGEGECPQYWKSKGGSTYVVRGTEDTEVAAAAVQGNCRVDDYSEERVCGVHQVPVDKFSLEDWEWSYAPRTEVCLIA